VRAFFAVGFDAQTIEALDRFVDAMRTARSDAPIAWEPSHKLHVTLQFLGEVGDDLGEPLARAGESIARRHAPFALSFARPSAFPNERAPRIAWIGVDVGADRLGALAADVRSATGPLGIVAEPRPFVPHVTIARTKSRRAERALQRLLASGVATPLPATRVDALVLMASRDGRYDVVHRWQLVGRADESVEPSPAS